MCCFRPMPPMCCNNIFMPRPMPFGCWGGGFTPFFGGHHNMGNAFAWGAGMGIGMGAIGLIGKVIDKYF